MDYLQLVISFAAGFLLGFIIAKRSNSVIKDPTHISTTIPTNSLSQKSLTGRAAIKTREELETMAKELIKSGKLLHAIKVIHENTTLGLKESKDYAEALRDGKTFDNIPFNFK